jgi:hypothetical protein
MSALQGYLEKLGGNFLVASFIPSLAFVIASIVTLGPIIPARVLLHIPFLLNSLGELSVTVTLVAVVIGFTLTSLNTQVYKFFEGYVFSDKLSFFRKQEIRRARELRLKEKKLSRQIARLELWDEAKLPARSKRQKGKIQKRLAILEAQKRAVNTSYDQSYPPLDFILPTRLGNILRAAEYYPLDRYNMDAVPMWPRMIHAISTADKGDSFLAKVDFSNDQCSFLLNASLLSGIYAGMAFIASLYQYLTLYLYHMGVNKLLYFIPIQPVPEVYTQRAVIYLVLGLLGLCGMWFFYNASLWNVSAYGNLIRSTYDLFRFNLLECLHLDLPEDNSENENTGGERFIWQKLSKLFNIGHPVYFEYTHSKKSSDSE